MITMDIQPNMNPLGTNPCRLGQLGAYEALFKYYRVARIKVTLTWLGSTVDTDDASVAELDPDVPIVYCVWDPDGTINQGNFALGKFKQFNLGNNKRSFSSTWSRVIVGLEDTDMRATSNTLGNTMPRRAKFMNISNMRIQNFYGPKFFVRLQRGTLGPPPVPRLGYFDIKTEYTLQFCGERTAFATAAPTVTDFYEPDLPDIVNSFDAVGADGDEDLIEDPEVEGQQT